MLPKSCSIHTAAASLCRKTTVVTAASEEGDNAAMAMKSVVVDPWRTIGKVMRR